MLRIGLIQMRSEKGAVSENLAVTAGYLAEAKARELDIVGFPEMSITGYADPSRFPQAVIRLDGPEVGRFLDLTRGLPATVLAGLIEENHGQAGGGKGKPFITHIAAWDGQLLGFYRKVTIKDDEEKWFSPGSPVPVFQHHALTYGISICADIGNEAVFAECARQGARIVFELAAPGLYGEQATRNWQSGFAWWRGECREKLGGYARKYQLWIGAATQAGRTVDEDFPGGGYLFAPDGQCLFETPDWTPGAVYLEIDLEQQRVTTL
jgi:predicted amidohydrolase